MKYYIDDSFVVCGDTLINYSGSHKALTFPPHFAGSTVSVIGEGAFMYSDDTECIFLPWGIRTIAKNAFSNCQKLTSLFVPSTIQTVNRSALINTNLRDITVWDIKLDANEYHSLIHNANRTPEGICVMRSMPRNIESINILLTALAQLELPVGILPALNIPSNIPALFHLVDSDEAVGKFSMSKNIFVIGFDTPSVPDTEDHIFYNYTKKIDNGYYNKTAEQYNDKNVRTENLLRSKKTVILTFDNANTRQENGIFTINATLRIGHFFWQSAQPVMYDDKKYYVYRRHYLNGNADIEYIRRDIAVYSDEGVVNNRSEAMNVYAKYKLLSIL